MNLRPGELDTLARIERPIAASGFRGAGAGTWALVDEVWIGIRDQLGGREQAGGGMPVAARTSRVRMYWRDDIMPDMRIVAGDRVLQIITEPAEIGRRCGLEMMTEEHRPAGNPA